MILCRLVPSLSGVLLALTLLHCKPKESDSLASSSGLSHSSASGDQRFEWCKTTPEAWSSLTEAIRTMEMAGKTHLNMGLAPSSLKGTSSELAPKARAMLNSPPASEPPSCGEQVEQMFLQSKKQVEVALRPQRSDTGFALGGSCEMANSSGVMAITRLASGHYRIEVMGCEGRTRSEMIMSPAQLKSLAGTLLRGV
jgi:hypothetical protein